uniref:Uncharacterized protein n=1 Tax=Triticum urartu TaxID=4572 RepID=A0A8R7TKU9_TRIUA
MVDCLNHERTFLDCRTKRCFIFLFYYLHVCLYICTFPRAYWFLIPFLSPVEPST